MVGDGETPALGVKVILAAAGVVGSVAAPALPSVEVISDVGGDRNKVNKEFLTASNVEDVREKVSMQIQDATNNVETGSVLQRSSTTNPPPFDGESETTQFRKADSDIFSHVGLKNEDNSGTSYVDYFTDYDFAADGDDSDYLVGGIALWVPKDSAITPWIGAAASGNDPFDGSSGMGIRAVLGSATYSGRARGIFTNKRDDVIQSNRAFKADVNLMANFGSVGMGGTISGTVSGFSYTSVDSDEYLTSVGDNSVTLGAAPIGTTDSGFFTGNTSVIDDNNTFADTGKWGGQFYGNGDAQPGSVAGTFGASTGDFSIDTNTVSILGVFGVYKPDEIPENEVIRTVSMQIQAAANNAPLFGPLFGNVSQLSSGTSTFKVVLPHENGKLAYKVNRLNADGMEEVIDFADSETTQFLKAEGKAFSRVALEKTRNNGISYIDVFTDYELPVTTGMVPEPTRIFSAGDVIPNFQNGIYRVGGKDTISNFILDGVRGTLTCPGGCYVTNRRVDSDSADYAFTPVTAKPGSREFSAGMLIPNLQVQEGRRSFDPGAVTLNGVRGTLTCPVGDSCSLINGRVGSDSDNLVFIPNDSVAAITDANADRDYLVGGIWLSVPEDASADPWIGASANGNDPFGDSSGMGIVAVTGSATYSGRAGGILVSNEENFDFGADVALTANFDAAMGGMISGTVSDFTDPDSGESLSTGVVLLGETSIGTTNSGFFTGGTSVVGTGEAEDFTGRWGGQFYGNPDASATGNNAQPGSVAGTFGASSDDKGVLGVFGAYKLGEIPSTDSVGVTPTPDGGSSQLSSFSASELPGSQAKLATAGGNNANENSVTQSSNSDGTGNNPTTTDSVEVAVTYNSVSEKLDYRAVKTAGTNGISVTISSADDKVLDRQSLAEAKLEGEDLASVKLYKKLQDGRLWVDIYTNNTPTISIINAVPASSAAPASSDYVPATGVPGGPDYVPAIGVPAVSAAPAVPAESVVTQDTDYLAGGIWIYVPDDASSLADYEFGAFIDGPNEFEFTQANLVGLTSTAVYGGDDAEVTGIFADESTGENTFFDADVHLTANFGTNSELGMISGRIYDFEDSADEYSFLGDSELTLSVAMPETNSSSLFTGETRMTFDDGQGDQNYTGKWGAQFYGNGATATDHPSSVAGTFGAATPEGANRKSLLGVFGAFKLGEIPPDGGGSQLSSFSASELPGSQAKLATAATAEPKEGSVTQSSNTDESVDNPTTTDFVEVSVEFAVRNGQGMLDYTMVKTDAGNRGREGTISSTDDEVLAAVQSVTEGSYVELYKKLPNGRVWVDIYTDRKLAEEDTDYLAGGIWVYVPDDASSLSDYEYGAFGDGNDPFTKGSLVGLTGGATYSGSQTATGVYADTSTGRNTFFNADVRLTADFGTNSELGTIHGRIDNFVEDTSSGAEGGDMVAATRVFEDASPVVMLESASITNANNGGFFTNDTETMTEFNEQNYEGKWGGSFFGNPDSGASGADLQPGSIGGTFGAASTGDGPSRSILGVFGAFKDEE